MIDIRQLLYSAESDLPLSFREARNISLACVIEPCSKKPGCVTRIRDENKNTLEMFLSAGVNIFYPFYCLAEHVSKNHSTKGIYQFLSMALLHSKLKRQGGQINMGILEFGLPIVAAHAHYDQNSLRSPEWLFSKAQEVVNDTDDTDAEDLIMAKKIGQQITMMGRGKTYNLELPNASSVRDFYEKEMKREIDQGGHVTGVLHNRQFVESFPDIKKTFDYFTSQPGSISERAAHAYRKMMAEPSNLGIGVGLVADFIALAIYLDITYSKDKELIY